MATSNHVAAKLLKDLHQPKDGAAEKGCLTRDKSPFVDNHKCSHRWQGLEHAKQDPTLYNYPAYRSLCRKTVFVTSAYLTKSKRFYPPGYKPYMKPPRPGEWDLPGGGAEASPSGDNFRKLTKPYWNNAHHIIPDSTLAAAIAQVSKPDPRIDLLIRIGLLKGEYNLNDKENVIILPLDKTVAGALGLPRHLKLHHVGPNESGQYADHPDYSQQVKEKVGPVMDSYADLVRNSKAYKENHPKAADKLSRARLVYISKQTYQAIKMKGAFSKGKSLDELF